MNTDDPTATVCGQIPVKILAMARIRRGSAGPHRSVALFDCEVVGFRLRGCFLVSVGDHYKAYPPQTAPTPEGFAVEIFSKSLQAQITRIAAAHFNELQTSGERSFNYSAARQRKQGHYAERWGTGHGLAPQASATGCAR